MSSSIPTLDYLEVVASRLTCEIRSEGILEGHSLNHSHRVAILYLLSSSSNAAGTSHAAQWSKTSSVGHEAGMPATPDAPKKSVRDVNGSWHPNLPHSRLHTGLPVGWGLPPRVAEGHIAAGWCRSNQSRQTHHSHRPRHDIVSPPDRREQ